MNLELGLALAVNLCLASGPGSGPAAAAPATPPTPPQTSEAEGEPGAPTRGSAEDLALWRSMQDDLHRNIVQRATAHRLYYRLRPERENTRLAAIGRAHPDLLPQVEALQRRLHAERKENYEIMAAQWPVDPRRACRSEMDDLAVAADAQAGPVASQALRSARVAAKVCTEKLRSALDPLTRSNVQLAAAVKDVEAFLASAPAPARPPVAGGSRAEHPDDDERDEAEEERVEAPAGGRAK